MIYKRNNRKISHQLRINIMVPVVVFGRYNFPGQLLQPKLAFITPCPPSYLTVDRFYYLLALPEQSQSPTNISAVKNGFYPRFSCVETRSFIQDCQQNSSYYVPHNANSNMCYRDDNDGYLHNWFVSPLQNHTIYLRVR